ncbi:SIS domain-containing protein [Sporosarcina sp. 179-K 8C2 HS]|uniref:SIS domain-containing protein n=1 Tax=Sporosarcina sp. 179-K 8C2 HS TaxID=3142387 RepID=UPI0039A0BA0E
MILSEIRERLESFSPSEKKIATYIIEQPHEIVKMSIGKVAFLIDVSEPTVIRFCRRLDFDGFKEFKFYLTRELASDKYYVHKGIKVGDDANSYIRTIGQYSLKSISELIKNLDPALIEHAVQTLSNASKIEFWGFGASGAVALDAHNKFFRLGIPCSVYSDPHMQCMSGSLLGNEGVIIAISNTGKSKELIENIEIARGFGATVIGITSKNTPLGDACSLVINAELDEDTNIFTPMVSRLTHLMIIDILVVGVSLQKGEQVSERLKTMKKVLSGKKQSVESGDLSDTKTR